MFFWLIALSATFPLWSIESGSAQTRATLESDTEVATEGYFVLTWQVGNEADDGLVLQRDVDPRFSDPLERSIPASGSATITGLEDGQYYFRAGSPVAGWSPSVMVEVRHHSLGRAFSFFFLGLALFAVLMVTIYIGHRATRTRIFKGRPPQGGAG